MRNTRKNERRAADIRGWITGLGENLAPCLIENISPSGAKLIVDSGQPPDEFRLYFSPHATTFRQCLVRWRQKECVGVQFGAAGPARKPG